MGLLWTIREAFASRKPTNVATRQRARLAESVASARLHSPFYRKLYQDLPESVDDPTLLPVTNKKTLMAHFDDWATNREVAQDRVRPFVENPDLIGKRFLGKYIVATTSGTTGTPGIFVIDEGSLSTANAMALRALLSWIGWGDAIRLLGRRRMALTVAAGVHSATAVAAARLQKSASGRKRVLALSVHMPLEEMIGRLNEFRPALFAPYASVAKLLATEQEEGRLNIEPVLIVPSAEGLPVREYDRIANVFRAKVETSYAATECPFLSYSCADRWLHVNSDWAILEPVDSEYRPVPPGEQSHTVLLTNLANRVQPVLRYDLGDRVVARPEPCPCGNPLPAIRVQGRSADMLKFSGERGERIAVPPLALEVDHVPGVELFQIEQRSPTSLRVRLSTAAGADRDRVWEGVHKEISRVLAAHHLGHVTVERAEEPPEQSPGGKYRTIVPLKREDESE